MKLNVLSAASTDQANCVYNTSPSDNEPHLIDSPGAGPGLKVYVQDSDRVKMTTIAVVIHDVQHVFYAPTAARLMLAPSPNFCLLR